MAVVHVTCTYEPEEGEADPDNIIGLTEEAYDRLVDRLHQAGCFDITILVGSG